MAAVYTSITLSYLAKARVLVRSVKRHNPGYRFYLVLAEPAPPWLAEGIAGGREPFDRLVTIDDLPIADKAAWLFGLDVIEACTGVKAAAMQLLQEKFGEDRVIYLDPDIAVFHGLEPLVEMLGDHSILLTPHCPAAETEIEAMIYNEISSLAHGIYNLGFIAVAGDAEGRRLTAWWAQRLRHFCHYDIPRGLFTDQRWIDLVPAQFDRVNIVPRPGVQRCLLERHAASRQRLGAGGASLRRTPLVLLPFLGDQQQDARADSPAVCSAEQDP